MHVNSKTLLRAINLVRPAVSKVKPILGKMLLKFKDNKAVISATDLDVYVSSGFECESRAAGSMILPPSVADIIKEYDGEVVLETTDSGMSVATDVSEFKFSTESPDDFPDMVSPFDTDCEIEGDVLKRMLFRSLLSASKEEAGKFLTSGVCWRVKNEVLKICSCDTKCVSEVSFACDFPDISEKVINRKAVNSIIRVLNGKCSFAFSENAMIVNTESATVICRLMEGRFPPYESVWPKTFAYELELPEVAVYLRQIAATMDPEDFVVVFNFEAGNLVLSSSSKESVGRIVLPVKCGFRGEIAMDIKRLIGMISEAEGDVVMKFNNGANPVVFDNGDFKYMIMPCGK